MTEISTKRRNILIASIIVVVLVVSSIGAVISQQIKQMYFKEAVLKFQLKLV
jgi:VIT1/CCC1 family predicted Fe2+/Mn2+ transporter